MIKFPCPHCEINIDAEPQYAGASANCPSCGGDLVVPTAASCSPVSPDTLDGDPEEPADNKSASANLVENRSEISEIPSMPGDPDDFTEVDSSPGRSLGTVLSSFAKSAAHEVKLNSKIAVLKTRIENAKRTDLRKAHYVLGRKLYDSRIFLSMRDEIEALEHQLAKTGERAIIEENESKGTMLKRMGKNAAKFAESEFLSQSLKQSLTRLGELARSSPQQSSLPGIENEMEAISRIESKIQELEDETSSLRGASQAGNQGKQHETFKGLLVFGLAAAIILLAITLGPVSLSGKKYQTESEYREAAAAPEVQRYSRDAVIERQVRDAAGRLRSGEDRLRAPEGFLIPQYTPPATPSVVEVTVIECGDVNPHVEPGRPRDSRTNWCRVSTRDGRTFLLNRWEPIGKTFRYQMP